MKDRELFKYCMYHASAHLNKAAERSAKDITVVNFDSWSLRSIEKHIHQAQALLWAAAEASKRDGQ